MIQLSILKITEYGPWTLTLGSDREHELQMLQASLYKQIQQLFSAKNCLVFLNKSDEFFVVSNGLALDDHIEIQKSLKKLFEVTLTISIGYGNTPFEANLKAYDGKQNNIILNQEHNIFGFIDDKSEFNVSIMHLDIDDLKSKRKDTSPYEISAIIFEIKVIGIFCSIYPFNKLEVFSLIYFKLSTSLALFNSLINTDGLFPCNTTISCSERIPISSELVLPFFVIHKCVILCLIMAI